MSTLIDRNNLLNKGLALFKKACDDAPNEEVFKAVQNMGSEFEELIKSSPTVEVPSWIPVTERLPETEGEYLIHTTIYFIPDHVDDCDHYDGTVICWYSPEYGFMGASGRRAKAWMPMPETYKEVE